MKTLDVLNLALRSVGKPQVNAPSTENIDANTVKGVLDRERKAILATGYPFNTDTITLEVDPTGKVPINRSYLKVKLPTRMDYRDDPDGTRYVFDLNTQEYHDATINEVEVIFDVEIDKLPDLFAKWIAQKVAEIYWSDCNAGAENPGLIRRRTHAQAVAINSLADFTNINIGTRAGRLHSIHGSTAVRFDGHWVELP